MKKLILLPILFAIIRINGQSIENRKFQFLDVNLIIKELIKNDYVSNYEFSLDYDAILSLDVSLLPILMKFDPLYSKS